MSKLRTITVSSLCILLASPVFADNSIIFDLDADVSEQCGVYSADLPPESSEVDLSFGDLGLVPTTTQVTAETQAGAAAVSVSYVCNVREGFMRTISSDNNGFLVRGGSSGNARNRIAFTMSHSGDGDIGFSDLSLTVPRVDSYSGSREFLMGRTADVSFDAFGVLVDDGTGPNNTSFTSVFAGDYEDVVTIAVVAN